MSTKTLLFISALTLSGSGLACPPPEGEQRMCSCSHHKHEQAMSHQPVLKGAVGDDDVTQFQRSNDAAMIEMHNAMANVKLTGNPDIDFMALMIPHHAGAVKMAEIILETSSDIEIRNLAQGIITEQKNEINIMKHLIEAKKNDI